MNRNFLEFGDLEHSEVVLGVLAWESVDLINGGVIADLIDHLAALFNPCYDPVSPLFSRFDYGIQLIGDAFDVTVCVSLVAIGCDALSNPKNIVHEFS